MNGFPGLPPGAKVTEDEGRPPRRYLRTRRRSNRASRCVNCSYDLSNLATVGDCPECGVPRVDSIEGADLRLAPVEHLCRLRSGSVIALAGACVLTAAFVVYIPATETWGRLTSLDKYFGLLAAFAALSLIGAALFTVGIIRLTDANPRQHRAARRSLLRRGARAAAILILCAFIVLFGITLLAILADSPPDPDYPATLLFPAILVLPAMVFCVPLTAIVFAYMAKLADSLADSTLKQHATIVAYAYPPVMVLGFLPSAASYVFGPLLGALLLLYITASLSRRLRDTVRARVDPV